MRLKAPPPASPQDCRYHKPGGLKTRAAESMPQSGRGRRGFRPNNSEPARGGISRRSSVTRKGTFPMSTNGTNPLGDKLRAYRKEMGMAPSTVAEDAGLDRDLVLSLEAHARDWQDFPLHGRDLIIRLAIALALDVASTDELLQSAGFVPLFPTVRRVRR